MNPNGTGVGAGNPINLLTGNKYQEEVDLPSLPGELGLQIVRHYNSSAAGLHHASGLVGRGWRLGYETTLYAGEHALTIHQADGAKLYFLRSGTDPKLCVSENARQGRIEIHEAADRRKTTYVWHWPAIPGRLARQLTFDAHGKLTRIEQADGHALKLEYEESRTRRLTKVTDPQDRTLVLHYPSKALAGKFQGVSHIDTPLGRFTYRYGEPLMAASATAPTQPVHDTLTVVVKPDSSKWLYHHEDSKQPWLMTGISVTESTPVPSSSSAGISAIQAEPVTTRISSYMYDARGMAIISVRGVMPPSPLEISSSKPLTGELAKTSPEFIRITRFRAPMGTTQGVTEIINGLGHSSSYITAMVGQQARLMQALGPGCAQCPPANTRWTYNDKSELTATIALDRKAKPLYAQYNTLDDMGRTTAVHEQWFEADDRLHRRQLRERAEYDGTSLVPSVLARPSVVGGKEHVVRLTHNEAGQVTRLVEEGFTPIDEQGHAKPVAMSRTSRSIYTSINGKQLLARVDGPLPNGPMNEPVDSDITAYKWDAQGNHLIRVTRSGGFSTRQTHDNAGRIASVVDDDGFASRFEYAKNGTLSRVVTTTPSGFKHTDAFSTDALGREIERGVGRGDDYRARTRQSFDSANRLQWRAHAIGWAQQWTHDVEGHELEHALISPYIVKRQRRKSKEAEIQDSLLSESSTSREGLGPSQFTKDDFGRVVATNSNDSGTTLWRFDAGDRLISMRDALGNEATYSYDAAGRIKQQAAHAVGDPNTKGPTVTSWHYDGRRLTAIDHPTHSERFTYNANGWRISRAISIAAVERVQASSAITRYEHDAHGRLAASTLPDGSVIAFERNGQGQVVSLTRSAVRTDWLKRFEKTQTIAHGFERDAVGLVRYTVGNGVAAQLVRSRDGTLARVVYRMPTRTTMTAHEQPVLMSRAAQSTVEKLLGIAAAHAKASQPNDRPPAPPPSDGDNLPGALGAPVDPAAFIDHRYLWSPRGNLLLDAQRPGTDGAQALNVGYDYDAGDRLVATQWQAAAKVDGLSAVHANTAATQYQFSFFDRQGRRVLSSDDGTSTRRTTYAGQSHRWLRDGDVTATYDATGQPKSMGSQRLTWDAFGRLAAVHDENHQALAQYAYNHRGERVAKSVNGATTRFIHDDAGMLLGELDASGKLSRQYINVAGMTLAVIDGPATLEVARSAWSQVWHDAMYLAVSWLAPMVKPKTATVWLHANHLGAPEAATDEQANIVWKASYRADGRATVSGASTITLNLRLPGQYLDAETGLHYNRHRYYDPMRAQFLTPDPLAQQPGYPDGPNPYAYTRYNPLRYVDPSGLVLFAFDGTGNDLSSLTNVRLFAEAYDFQSQYDSTNGVDGMRYYLRGPGTGSVSDWDDPVTGGMVASRMRDMVNIHLRSLANYVARRSAWEFDQARTAGRTFSPEQPLDISIDVVGFSRGAAAAREFMNRVNELANSGAYREYSGGMCVRVYTRFAALFDSVLGTNVDLNMRMQIPASVQHVSHAIAVHEQRTLFPLESIEESFSNPGFSSNRIERGFLGAHSDVGGGYAGRGGDGGDLSDVALNWMVAQAARSGVVMSDLRPAQLQVTNPFVHDERRALMWRTLGLDPLAVRDRAVRYRNASDGPALGSSPDFADAPTQGMNRNEAQNLNVINWRTLGLQDINNIDVGTVVMQRYRQWLEQNYGLTLQ